MLRARHVHKARTQASSWSWAHVIRPAQHDNSKRSEAVRSKKTRTDCSTRSLLREEVDVGGAPQHETTPKWTPRLRVSKGLRYRDRDLFFLHTVTVDYVSWTEGDRIPDS